jgi:alpha-N-arabinofuranosidase
VLIERARYEQKIEHPIGIAFDEWNVWYRTRSPELRQGLEEQYDLSDALAVATYLNIFIRHCRSVEIANFAQLVNAIAAIFTRPEGMFLQTVYHPLRLYAEHMQEVALDPFVHSPEIELRPEDEQDATPWDRPWKVADLGPFKLLDVSATRDAASRELCVAVVNRDAEQAIATRVELAGRTLGSTLHVYEVNGPDPTAVNSFDQPDLVNVREQRLDVQGGCVDVTFAPHSVTLLRCRLA